MGTVEHDESRHNAPFDDAYEAELRARAIDDLVDRLMRGEAYKKWSLRDVLENDASTLIDGVMAAMHATSYIRGWSDISDALEKSARAYLETSSLVDRRMADLRAEDEEERG